MLTADRQEIKASALRVADRPRAGSSDLLSRLRHWWARRRRSTVDADSPSFQPYRSLARQLLADFPCADGGRVIIVSSVASLPTDTLLTLCYFMRDELGSRILAIDATGRSDGLGARLGHGRLPGFLDLLHSDDKHLADLVQQTARPGISALPPGRPPADGLAALRAARVERVFAEARRAYDYVIVQQPAILEDRGFLRFAASADVVLLLVEEGRTGLSDLTKCRAVLEAHRAQNVRVVLCSPG